MTWSPPTISLKWGSYFAPDTDDDAAIVTLATAAHDGGLVTLRAAVEKVKRTFNIENVDQFVEALKEEAQEKRDQLTEDMHAMAAVGGGAADNEPGQQKPGKPAPAAPAVKKPKKQDAAK